MKADRSFFTSSRLSNPQLELVLDFPSRRIDLQNMVKGLMLLFPRNTKCLPLLFPFFCQLLSFFSLFLTLSLSSVISPLLVVFLLLVFHFP